MSGKDQTHSPITSQSASAALASRSELIGWADASKVARSGWSLRQLSITRWHRSRKESAAPCHGLPGGLYVVQFCQILAWSEPG